jgi:phage shock protein PspC (stress-responsive transcriptional regulator)
MTTSQPNNPEPGERRQQPVRVERSRSDRVLGGVCGGIARSVGVDPVLVRIAVVLVGLVSGGTAVLAYLVAWVLLPQAAEDAQPRPRVNPPPAGDAKEAWTAVGGELKALAAELRPKQGNGEAPTQPEATQGPNKRPSLKSVDAALTGLGDRLRAPEVQEGARRALTGLSAAVDASVGEIGNRVRRERPEPGAAPSNEPEGPRTQP